MEKFVVYVGEFHGKGKESGKPFHLYKFMQLFVIDGIVCAKEIDLFAKDRISGSDLIDFGTVVDLGFADSDILGGRPTLVSIDPVQECPYHELMK